MTNGTKPNPTKVTSFGRMLNSETGLPRMEDRGPTTEKVLELRQEGIIYTFQAHVLGHIEH